VLNSMKDRLTESGRYYRMEMKLEKRKLMIISAEPSPLQITIKVGEREICKVFGKHDNK
jgi:hypothetical protein